MKILYFSVIVDTAIVVSNNNINQDDIQVSHIKSLVFNEISDKLKSLNINNFASLKLWKVDGKKNNVKNKVIDKETIHIIVQPVAAGGLGGTTHRRLEAAPSMKALILIVLSYARENQLSSNCLDDKLLKLDEVQNGSACVFRISLVWMQKYTSSWKFYGDVCIVALASYGHYGAYATSGSRLDMDISPVNNFSMKNKWGYEDICFTKKEFRDYFYNFCESHDFNDLIKNARAFYSTSDLSDEERKIVTSVLYRKGGLPYNSKEITYVQHVWQMEFYRASMQVLPEGNYVSVDVGACFGTIGYIDFYISNEKKLALIDIHHNKMKLIYPDESEEIVRLLGEEDDLIAIVGVEAHDYYKHKDHDYD
ncbi:hypothetical protein RhiirA4_456159 [Rhizophagus irregularis]|uniref:Uncharacterized protein n=1 Tax=Rhizophagus irregularis TaxID=588596 RepID=A0A2I1G6X8_9GLOM|nr:hypothetical protein RhiirA4_456159 [Rhizophagus irregularis]